MLPRPSASFPSSTDKPEVAGRGGVGVEAIVRLALGAWAAAVYLVYWLGYLGLR